MDFTDPNLRFARASDHLSTDLDGEVAILNLESKLYFGLADVAAVIWRELGSPTSLDGLLEAVMTEYAVEEAQCRTDIEQFLKSLNETGLIEMRSEGADRLTPSAH